MGTDQYLKVWCANENLQRGTCTVVGIGKCSGRRCNSESSRISFGPPLFRNPGYAFAYLYTVSFHDGYWISSADVNVNYYLILYHCHNCILPIYILLFNVADLQTSLQLLVKLCVPHLLRYSYILRCVVCIMYFSNTLR
jgi:hypothetical protein